MDAVYDTCNARDSHNKSINCPISANQMWAHIWTLAAYGAAEHCQTWPTGLLKELAIYFTTACCKLRGALAPVPPPPPPSNAPVEGSYKHLVCSDDEWHLCIVYSASMADYNIFIAIFEL